MCIVKTQEQQPLITYLPASLKYTAHGWTIEYRVFNPAFNAMERRVIKMNRIRKKYSRITDFKSYCAVVIAKLNSQLASGWNPFAGVANNSREMTPIDTVLDKYLKDKSGELRADTIINYRSFVKLSKEWVIKNYGQIAVFSFSRLVAQQPVTETETVLDATDWAAGTYVWKVVSNKAEIESGKWVKE